MTWVAAENEMAEMFNNAQRGDIDATGKLTAHGKERQALGAGGRAKDRAVRASGGDSGDYTYDAKTNTARKKK